MTPSTANTAATMPKTDKKQVSVRDETGGFVSASQIFHEGPLPSPEDYRGYAETQPDFPGRYMSVVENHHAYLIEAHKTETRRNHVRTVLGQLLAFAICIGMFAVAAWGLAKGFPWFALGMSAVAVVCVVVIARPAPVIIRQDTPREKDGK